MNKFFTAGGLLLLVFFPRPLASQETMTPTLEPAAPPAEETPPAALPAALDLARYEALGKKSPFTAVTAEETASFAQDLTLAGFVRLKGEDFVMVANRANASRFLVGQKASPSAQGLVLMEVIRDPKGDATKMKAKVKKGAEVATLSFEATAAAPATPPGQPPMPGVPQPAPVVPGAQALPGQKPPAQLQPGQNRPNPPVIRRRVIPVPPAR